ncbi:MAG: ribosome-recycling factor, partial [Minisyncoccia bacterium]
MDIFKQFQQGLNKIIEEFKKELVLIRTNRPNPGLVENIKINYFDQVVILKHISSISIVPPRELHIMVWDKGMVNNVAKAIENANLGLTVIKKDNAVIASLPELSQERKMELIKQVKELTENHKIKMRQLRDETNKSIQKLFSDHK